MTPKEVLVVELPITDEQAVHMYFEHYAPAIEAGKGRGEATSSAIRSVGVRAESGVPIVNYEKSLVPVEVLSPTVGTSSVVLMSVNKSPLIRQSDHLAALAEKEAEVQRLRIAECNMKEAAVHLLRTMERSDLTKTERVNAAIRQINALFIPELTGAAS